LPGKQYCAEHDETYGNEYQFRRSSAERGYSGPWRRLRLLVIHRDPLCVDPFQIGCTSASTDVDHIIPKQQGGKDSMENLQGLCESCHARKTLLEKTVAFACYSDAATSFTVCGNVITLHTSQSAPANAMPLKDWPITVLRVRRQGGRESLHRRAQ
jgi:5-methylcytosine-specific restriction protein A